MNTAIYITKTGTEAGTAQMDRRAFWLWLIGILLIALALRLLFFRGMMGSDDAIYFERALQIAGGEWSSADYNGALRYGFNIPAGLFIYIFGANIFAANLFSLMCSLGEIALIGCFARRYWGPRVGLMAALILASMPLHVSAATTIHADPIAAFFITASFICFWRATETGSALGFFMTGLLIGFVFWVKELIIIYAVVFLIYALIERRFDWKWSYVIAGGLVMLFGHLALIWAIAGDPFHSFKIYLMQIDRDFIGGGKETEALYYFYYLFFDLRHNSVVPYLALAGIIGILAQKQFRENASNRFLATWLIGLLAVFSFTPISLDPFQLITKQSNYLNLYFAPLALVAAIFLARLSWRWALPILATIFISGSLLAALGQQDLRKFVANSKAVAQFAQDHPGATIYTDVNNRNITSFYAMLQDEPQAKVKLLRDLESQPESTEQTVFIVIDKETNHWGAAASHIYEPKPCWQLVKTLEPQGYGFGQPVTKAIIWFIRLIPGQMGHAYAAPFEDLLVPQPATVYRALAADPWCTA